MALDWLQLTCVAASAAIHSDTAIRASGAARHGAISAILQTCSAPLERPCPSISKGAPEEEGHRSREASLNKVMSAATPAVPAWHLQLRTKAAVTGFHLSM